MAAASSMGTNASLLRLAFTTADQVWLTLDARLVGTTVRRTLDLPALRVRPKAAISSASTKPIGPTATLRAAGLVRCDQAPAPSPHAAISAAATMNHRQALFTSKPQRSTKPGCAA